MNSCSNSSKISKKRKRKSGSASECEQVEIQLKKIDEMENDDRTVEAKSEMIRNSKGTPPLKVT